jgi:thiol:disulfide interchange protein
MKIHCGRRAGARLTWNLSWQNYVTFRFGDVYGERCGILKTGDRMKARSLQMFQSVSPAMRISFLVALIFIGACAGQSALAQGTRQIYSDTADPHSDIAHALADARMQHKRVIVDFGGNWCGDCKVLDIYFHQQPNLSLLDNNFVLAHVNIGHYDKNLDIVEKYQIPIHNGVPLLMVLNGQGKVLFIQNHKEFEKMQMVTPASVTEFLNQWKPKR